jgi:hypothetical protein
MFCVRNVSEKQQITLMQLGAVCGIWLSRQSTSIYQYTNSVHECDSLRLLSTHTGIVFLVLSFVAKQVLCVENGKTFCDWLSLF